MKRLVVEERSGELVDELLDGDRILRKNSLDYLSSAERLNADAQYVKFYLLSSDALSRIPSMSTSGYRICLRLLPYVRYDTGAIANDSGAPINIEGVKRICRDMGERTIERALSELVSQDIFARVMRERQTCFFVNPYIFMRGAAVNKALGKMFHHSDWAKLYQK